LFFLSELDPNARVKGARDPLGTQSVWSGFGRLVVGNLTTQTTSLDDFRILLLGSWLIDQSAAQSIPRASVFVAWEQLASYARLVARQQGGFRGVTRVQRNLARREPIMISSDRAHQTLTNQAAYGIWGLYTAAASRSGMLTFDRSRLTTDEGRALVEERYLPALAEHWGRDARELQRWVTQGHELRPRTKEHHDKLEAIASCICDPLTEAERQYYRTTIVQAGCHVGSPNPPTAAQRRQTGLAAHLRNEVHADDVSRQDVELVAINTDDSDLAEQLEAIVAAESMLAPAVLLFNYVSNQPGTEVSTVIRELEQHFAPASTLLSPDKLERLRAVDAHNPRLLSTVGDENGQGTDRWLRIASALHDKDFETLVRLLLRQNELVTRDRGGTVGWVSVSPRGRIEVRLPSGGSGLPDPERVGDLWINGYFLTNLLTLARAVEAA
jgi:hypothetical protein